MNHHELEEGTKLALDFKKLTKVASCGEDLIPAIAQDHETKEVLIVGYANQLAFETAMNEKMATFWSTSRNELWIKGKTSGDYLEIIEIRVNCEQNSILYLVRPREKVLVIQKINPENLERVAIIDPSMKMEYWLLKPID